MYERGWKLDSVMPLYEDLLTAAACGNPSATVTFAAAWSDNESLSTGMSELRLAQTRACTHSVIRSMRRDSAQLIPA